MSTTPARETLLNCAGCGATVYPEHLERHLAGYWGGALYCSCCINEKKTGKPAAPAPAAPDQALTLEDAPAPAAAHSTPPPSPTPATSQAHRLPPRPGAKDATRVRIFHARLSDGAVAHLDHQMNEWLDQHPDIEIKFANTTVGVWEGKHSEPNLIVTVFY